MVSRQKVQILYALMVGMSWTLGYNQAFLLVTSALVQ